MTTNNNNKNNKPIRQSPVKAISNTFRGTHQVVQISLELQPVLWMLQKVANKLSMTIAISTRTNIQTMKKHHMEIWVHKTTIHTADTKERMIPTTRAHEFESSNWPLITIQYKNTICILGHSVYVPMENRMKNLHTNEV